MRAIPRSELRDCIANSCFNQDEAKRKVFDGALAHISGIGGVFLNAEFGQPARTNTQHEDHTYPENAFPFSTAPLCLRHVALRIFCQQQAVAHQGGRGVLYFADVVAVAAVSLGHRRPRVLSGFAVGAIQRQRGIAAIAIAQFALGEGRLIKVPAG